MTPIAVFYHARISGGSTHIDPKFGRAMIKRQLELLVTSGLYSTTDEIVVGLNGSKDDYYYVLSIAPGDISVLWHGEDAESLLPTMRFLQSILPDIHDHHCLFFHTKGVTHPTSAIDAAWRDCMEHWCIVNWRKCVEDLDKGYDSVGCHWLTPQRFPGMVHTPFWGGAFWWAKAKFLSRLPQLPPGYPSCREEWFIPERWIGTGPIPSTRDYHPTWPHEIACRKNICK